MIFIRTKRSIVVQLLFGDKSASLWTCHDGSDLPYTLELVANLKFKIEGNIEGKKTAAAKLRFLLRLDVVR
jgi:hypothetical protein